MKDKTEETTLVDETEVPADITSNLESADSKTDGKEKLFIHKENGKRVGFLGAQRIADGDKGKRWETEEETRERLTPIFELDIHESKWDENPSGPGLRAIRDKPKRKRPSPAARRRARKEKTEKEETVSEEETVESEIEPPTTDDVEEAESSDEEIQLEEFPDLEGGSVVIGINDEETLKKDKVKDDDEKKKKKLPETEDPKVP